MLRVDISPLGDDLLVLAEEYGDWVDSNRRIDLLCLDRQGRLVVVEIKRTDDGGHMDLQAVRYAAMVSSMTTEQALSALVRLLTVPEPETAARNALMEFLDLDSLDGFQPDANVRIILAAADFSTEITTTALWLNKRGLDVRCVRLRPYSFDGKLLIDATQIIPLPETADYEIRIREKNQEKERAEERSAGNKEEIFLRFWSGFLKKANTRTEMFKNRSPLKSHLLAAGIGRAGFIPQVSLTGDRARVECFVRPGGNDEAKNDAAFQSLEQQRAAIEASFGESLDWNALPQRSGSRISVDRNGGGWKSPESEWEEIQTWMVDRMVRLEGALKGPVQSLVLP